MMKTSKRELTDWRRRFDETRARIARLRRAPRLEETPRYATKIRESLRTLSVQRPAWTLVFDKRRAMATAAVIDGVRLDLVRLPHLLVIDENGSRLQQIESRSGDLAVRQEAFSVFLEGFFTLAERRVPVVYEIDRMSGTIFCTMDLPGPIRIRRMTLEHTLGRTPRPLDTFYAPHHYLKTFRPYRPMIINEHQVDTIFEKDTMQFWTDGHIGLQVFSVTWDKARVLDQETKFRYGTGEIRDGASWIDLTFFSTGAEDSIELPDGHRADCAFSLMPYRQWEPRSEIFSSAYLLPGPDVPDARRRRETSAILNHLGRAGVTLMCYGEPDPCFLPNNPAFTRWLIREARRNGIRVVLYIERSWIAATVHPQTAGMLTREEILEGRQELPSMYGPRDDGAAWWGPRDGPSGWGKLLTMCCNFEPWRVYVLTLIRHCLDKLGYDGVYLDTSFIGSCTNTRHGESPDESTAVRGALTFHQDLRLLLADLQRRKRREYLVINHYWDQHSAPVTGLGDFSMPGEQHAGRRMREMSIENLRYGYSAIPNGVNMIWYSSDTYDYTSPRIYNAAADCGGILWLRPYVEVHAENTPEGLLQHQRHMQPLVQYGLEGSRPVHRRSPDYSSLFQGGDRQTRAMLYLKPDSMLVHLVNDGPRRSVASFSVAVPKKWRRCLVLDAVNMRWIVQAPSEGRLAVNNLDCSGGPVAVVIRPCPRGPAIVWRDPACRGAALAVGGECATVTAHGVAHACAACYLHLPKGTTLRRGARLLPFVAEQVCLVPLAFDARGRSVSEFEITLPRRRA